MDRRIHKRENSDYWSRWFRFFWKWRRPWKNNRKDRCRN